MSVVRDLPSCMNSLSRPALPRPLRRTRSFPRSAEAGRNFEEEISPVLPPVGGLLRDHLEA